MEAVHSITVHGVGSQDRGYSDKATGWLRKAGRDRGVELYNEEVLWSPLLDDLEKKMLRSVRARGSAGRLGQREIVMVAADALSFSARLPQIFLLLDKAFARLRAPGKVVIFAHSLGCLLVTEWLRARPTVGVQALVTLGCNLELFNLGKEAEYTPPQQVAGKGRWINLFDDDDLLGWPLRGWLPMVSDVEVSSGGWFTKWNGLAHVGYWTTSNIWSKTVPTVLAW